MPAGTFLLMFCWCWSFPAGAAKWNSDLAGQLFGDDTGERESDGEMGRFKGHLKRGMEVRWVEDTWRTCLSLYEYLMPRTKTSAVNSEKVWHLKMPEGEWLTTEAKRGENCCCCCCWETSERRREVARECVEAWQGRETGDCGALTHTHWYSTSLLWGIRWSQVDGGGMKL